MKENGELLIIDHNKLSILNVFQDFSISQVENKVDELISNKKEIKSWSIKELDFTRCKNWRGDSLSEKIQQTKAIKYQAKANIVQEQVNYSDNDQYSKNIPFKSFKTFDEYYLYSLKHSIVPIDY